MAPKKIHTNNTSIPSKSRASVTKVDPNTIEVISEQTSLKAPAPVVRSGKRIGLKIKTSKTRVKKTKTPQPPMMRTKTYMGTVDGVRQVLLGPRHVTAMERRTRPRLTKPCSLLPEISAAQRLEMRITGKSQKQTDL
jgi:hypothetical protein